MPISKSLTLITYAEFLLRYQVTYSQVLGLWGEHESASHIVDVPQFNHSPIETRFISNFRL